MALVTALTDRGLDSGRVRRACAGSGRECAERDLAGSVTCGPDSERVARSDPARSGRQGHGGDVCVGIGRHSGGR